MAADTLGSPLLALRRLTAYGAFSLALMPVQVVALVLKLPLRTTLPYWYHRHCCRLLGIRVERRGRQSRQRPTLYVANHVSYMDITVLGSVIRGSFVAKAEVTSWPFFGVLARLQRSIFVDRQALRSADHRDAMVERLRAGDCLILFPEGTSGDGNRVLPFKSSLLAAAEVEVPDGPLTVQPVSLAYTMLDGMPLGRWLRPFCAWYGDMYLADHLWQAAGLGRLTVVVRFHEPVSLAEFGSRKTLSEHCNRVIALGMADDLCGRRGTRTGGAGRREAPEAPVPGAPEPEDGVADPASG
jgi:1-acyl-sn-glycerol-3-phosphate acyltransferase